MILSIIRNWRKRKILKLDKNKIHTHLTDNEKVNLYTLASGLKKNSVCVEIGSYLGSSSVFLSHALLKSSGSLYCVDTWENDAMTEGKRETYDEFSKNTLSYQSVITPLKGRSERMAGQFNKQIDLIFFDGDHSYEGIKQDWESWKDKLNPKSIVIFHDTGWAEGVKRVISEDVLTECKLLGEQPNMQWFRML